MANSQKAAPAKKQGFQGVRAAIWIIVLCFIAGVCFYQFVLGNPSNFQGGDNANAPLPGNLLGTIYKGGIVVPVIITLLFTAIALSVERSLALNTAHGKGKLAKFVTDIKAALAAGDIDKAQQLCDKQQGVVVNVVT
ncbi:MAG: MotA/TolQ/ExbB proton channel family protein, partial [Prevotella sp.]|nr:MotA/TolQ/ExbB proton channel family protein [Prevotella sp.]